MIPCSTSPIPHFPPQRLLLSTAVFLGLLISMFLNNKHMLLSFTSSIVDSIYWPPIVVVGYLDLLPHHRIPASCPLPLPVQLCYSP